MGSRKSNTVQSRFVARCDDLLNMMIEQARHEDAWDVYLAKGAGDRAIAGDHEERHLLELLQNARDAIYRGRLEGDNSSGRVMILVTERGMAMANTGSPFRLDREDVLKAVRFLMRSDKAGQGFVGHKGIGLKSILLRAGAFVVRSRVEGEVLRATFSRYRTAKHLLDWLNAIGADAAQYHYILDELPRLPLFTQPHADFVDDRIFGEDSDLLESLLEHSSRKKLGLNDTGIPASLAPYTTVVYLPYREPEWERLLDDLELDKVDHPIFQRAREQMGQFTRKANANTIWQELMMLDARMLILLGEIAEVQLVRFHQQRLIEARRIVVQSPLFPLAGREKFTNQAIHLQVWHWSRDNDDPGMPQSRTFSVLSAPTTLGVLTDDTSGAEGPPESIRILLEVPTSNQIHLKDEPLFLYYPIEASHSGLPFLIHGPFRVNTSRTALVPSQQAHNRAILEQAITLLMHSLPELLKPGSPLRSWLPWILLPLPTVEGELEGDLHTFQVELCQNLVTRLRKQRCIPTTRGLCIPEQVHFLPEHPDALAFLENLVVRRKRMQARFYLLERANLETYLTLTARNSEHWQRAASAIGLGQINLMAFVRELASQLEATPDAAPLSVVANQARAFFLSLCALLSGKDKVRNQQAAAVLGNGGVPLLPALPANGVEDTERLFLVPAEARERGGAELKPARRVVFWRPVSVKTRVSDLPTPPAAIPIYFIDPNVIEFEGARAEGMLSIFSNEWGVTRFESRPDLFRRVADRSAQLDGKTTLPVLGYLAGVLHQITTESFSGAEDLQPRPYAAINLELLRTALDETNRSAAQRNQDRQRLESLQLWAQILVPVKGGKRAYMPAENAVFGPAWATLLEQATPVEETDKESAPEQGWAQAIRALTDFRKVIGRCPTDSHYPEIADPDDARWQPAMEQFERVVEGGKTGQPQIAMFRLLLLLGVRISPRVAWRWLNLGQAVAFSLQNRSVDPKMSLQMFSDITLLPDLLPASLVQSRLFHAYCDTLTLKPYHPAFAAEHSVGHREHLLSTGTIDSNLAAWTWLPDLEDVDLDDMPFAGDLVCIDTFRKSLLAVWETVSDSVIRTGWYCAAGWHRGRSWKKTIPSLAAFQLSRLALWPARSDGRLENVTQRRFPAVVMVAWESEDSPAPTEPAGFFPLLDLRNAHDLRLARAARDLCITSLSEIDVSGAVLRLRWLLEESRITDIAPSGFWQITPLPGSSRDAWLAAQYRMLERIVQSDPKNRWDRHTVRICSLALRAVRGDEQIAIPVVGNTNDNLHLAIDVAFFQQSPRWWERQAHSGRWILETRSQLQTGLYRWAETMGAMRITPADPPAYKGILLTSSDAEAAVKDLRVVVQERLAHLLGVFKAHRAEKLEELAEQLKAALTTLTAVKPAADEEGWSGLNEAGRLVFSLDAYETERQEQRTGAIVLAEGIALLVKQTTAVGDLQHALSAPLHQVERVLKFQGVDLEVLAREVSALEQRRMRSLLERVDALLEALQIVGSGSRSKWNLSELADEQKADILHQLRRLEGPLATQILSTMPDTLSNLTHAAFAALLRIILDEGYFTQDILSVTRALLVILRDAGCPLDQRTRFSRQYLGAQSFDLYEHPKCAQMLNRAIVAGMIGQLVSGEWNHNETSLALELDVRARTLRDALLPVSPTESSEMLFSRLLTVLKVTLPLIEDSCLLLEFGDTEWERLSQNIRQNAQATLAQLPPVVQATVERCLQEGTLQPLTEQRIWHENVNQKHIQILEHKIAQGELVFAVEHLLDQINLTTSHLESVSAEVSEPGQSAGGGDGGITEDQAIRGRVAEWFVLEVCWQRYLRAGCADREKILATLTKYREGFQENVLWGTRSAWKNLKSRISTSWEDLLVCTAKDSRSQKLFKALIEVANERGPGFDVLDPFGVWGKSDIAAFTPCRVEVKAILPPMTKNSGYRVILSTNEFHRARQHPISYVLRLIYVPSDYEDMRNVRWAADIPNPVQTLKLDEKIVLGVRSGILPFVVHLG